MRLAMSNALAKLSRIRTALEAAKSIDDLVDLRDQVTAIATYAKASRMSLDNVNAAMEVKLRIDRKSGELLRGMEKVGHRPKKGDSVQPFSESLEAMGIAKHESHRWQKIAAIPEDEFTAYVSEFTDEKKELTSAAVMRKWSASQSPDNSKVAPEPVGLVASLNSLNSAMKRIYDSWPSEDIGVLSAKLRGFAEEIDETGRLEL